MSAPFASQARNEAKTGTFSSHTHLDDAMVIATAAGAPDGKTASVICRTRKLVDAELRDVIEHARDAGTRLTYRRPGYAMNEVGRLSYGTAERTPPLTLIPVAALMR